MGQKTQFYLTERQKILVNSLSPADRDALADYIEYTSSMADPKINPGGRLPEGSLSNLFNKQNPRVQAALAAMDSIIETPRFEPFQRKFSEAERLEELGLPIESGLTLKAASDAIDVGARLQQKMGNDASLPPRKPTLRDHLSAAASQEEVKSAWSEYADKEIADAGREANLPLRKHLEISSDVIGSNRGHNFDDDLITAKGNNDLREDVERAIISVAESTP